jgi:hypothetical protein
VRRSLWRAILRRPLLGSHASLRDSRTERQERSYRSDEHGLSTGGTSDPCGALDLPSCNGGSKSAYGPQQRASGRRQRPSQHDQFVRSFAEYRLSSAISFAAAFGGRRPLVTISRFSSFLP